MIRERRNSIKIIMPDTPSISVETVNKTHDNWKSFLKFDNSLSIYQYNIRGISDLKVDNNKFATWKKSIEELHRPPSIIVLEEVKLEKSKNLKNYTLEGYKLVSCRCETSKSGLLVYVRNSIYVIRQDTSSTSIQKVAINFEFREQIFDLLCFYRPPYNINYKEFFNSLKKSLNGFNLHHHIIVVGDINNDQNNYTKYFAKYTKILKEFDCEVVNDQTTRKKSESLLDHFVCSFKSIFPITVHTIEPLIENNDELSTPACKNLSDHSIVYAFVEVNDVQANYKRSVSKTKVVQLNFSDDINEIENLENQD